MHPVHTQYVSWCTSACIEHIEYRTIGVSHRFPIIVRFITVRNVHTKGTDHSSHQDASEGTSQSGLPISQGKGSLWGLYSGFITASLRHLFVWAPILFYWERTVLWLCGCWTSSPTLASPMRFFYIFFTCRLVHKVEIIIMINLSTSILKSCLLHCTHWQLSSGVGSTYIYVMTMMRYDKLNSTHVQSWQMLPLLLRQISLTTCSSVVGVSGESDGGYGAEGWGHHCHPS